MDIELAKKLIRDHAAQHEHAVIRAEKAERYYRKDNDILHAKPREEKEDPVRNADNRIPSNFYGLLVNQKASYLFSDPPLFDVGKKQDNQKIADALGDGYAKACKSLCINASNAAVAWLHIWKDEQNAFRYGVVPSGQVIPIWSSDLEKRLIAALRVYHTIDEAGTAYVVYEYWTDTECVAYHRYEAAGIDYLFPHSMFSVYDIDSGMAQKSNQFKHDWGEVPFISFFNNESCTSDLDMVKELIDCYDKVFSGFLNDLEDIQEVIYVLSGYGGQDLKEFVHDLRESKAIKLDVGDEGGKPGVETLTINIPVEAREKMLTMTRKAIFEQGQGIDPDPQNFGDSSGVALKFLYSLLELKGSLMETEFRLGFGRLVRLICKHLGIACDKVNQTWTRTSVSNDAELADIAAKSAGVISQRTILRRHPWVDDPEEEQKQIEKEQEAQEERYPTLTGELMSNGEDGVAGANK